MSLTDFIRGLDRGRARPVVSYPYLDTPDPHPSYIEVWPAGATRWRALAAYNPQNGPNGGNRTGVHVVVEHAFQHGRLARRRDDALCKPSRKFWGLEGPALRAHVSCKACRRLAATHGIDLGVEPIAVGTGDLWQHLGTAEPVAPCFFVTEFLPAERGATIDDVRVMGWYADGIDLPRYLPMRVVDLARWHLVRRSDGPADRDVTPGDVLRIAAT